MSLLVTLDPCGVLYVQFRNARVTKTIELVKDELLVDLDEDANILGIEALLPLELQLVVEPDEDEFHAYCPALKGLHTGGITQEEALENARNAAVAYILSLIKHGDSIP